MSCVVSLEPIMQINEIKNIEQFLSIPKSIAGVTTVSCVLS